MADRISATAMSSSLVSATSSPIVTMTPVPSDEEVAAIVAAVDAMWPGQAGGPGGTTRRPSVWKFSGRWWSQPIPLRRARPWT